MESETISNLEGHFHESVDQNHPRYCSFCGTQAYDKASKFCHFCGNKLYNTQNTKENFKEEIALDEGLAAKEEKPKEGIALSNTIDDVKKDISIIQEIINNIQCNVAMLVQNQAAAEDVAVMKRENEAFRSDSNMKLMRRYGIDAMIKTYQSICDRIYRIKHPKPDDKIEDAELTALNWVCNRMEKQFKSLGIKLNTSLPGMAVDESYMVVYGSDGEDVNDDETIIMTDDESLKDTVKESVCPAFIWTIPSLIGDVKEWCMEAEKVCIYK